MVTQTRGRAIWGGVFSGKEGDGGGRDPKFSVFCFPFSVNDLLQAVIWFFPREKNENPEKMPQKRDYSRIKLKSYINLPIRELKEIKQDYN
jgi:hypothetical protein